MTLTFEQIAEIEIEAIRVPLNERTFTGSVDIDSRPNEWVATPSGDGGYIVSMSDRKGPQGIIEVYADGVIYKDNAGAIVHRESRMRYPLTVQSIKTYYLPTLNAHL